MTPNITQADILAFAVLELRVLLSGHLGSGKTDDPPVRAAAHLAFALHNHAIAVLEGRSFDPADAVAAIAHVDGLFGENFVQRLSLAKAAPDVQTPGQAGLQEPV
jgi:hypothetical protein